MVSIFVPHWARCHLGGPLLRYSWVNGSCPSSWIPIRPNMGRASVHLASRYDQRSHRFRSCPSYRQLLRKQRGHHHNFTIACCIYDGCYRQYCWPSIALAFLKRGSWGWACCKKSRGTGRIHENKKREYWGRKWELRERWSVWWREQLPSYAAS